MKIAHLLPYGAVFPLKKHNGRYEWALRLARIQANAGHEVTIFAGPNSLDDSAIMWRSVESTGLGKRENNIKLLKEALQDQQYDIYHSHFDSLHYVVADLTDKPVVVTQHWFPSEAIAADVPLNFKKNVVTVPVTKMMQAEDKKLGIPAIDYIYHGIDLSLFSFGAHPSERFVFVGRVHPNKGVDYAIRYAVQAKIPLDIIGKVNANEAGFWESLQPLIDGKLIRYLGPKPLDEVAEAYRNAKAFLFPTQKPEAFGQVTIEAQACGTPVIIGPIGASRELVIDGKTGFICENEAEFLNAIERVGDIDRATCREHAEQFSLQTMIEKYDELYKHLVI